MIRTSKQRARELEKMKGKACGWLGEVFQAQEQYMSIMLYPRAFATSRTARRASEWEQSN